MRKLLPLLLAAAAVPLLFAAASARTRAEPPAAAVRAGINGVIDRAIAERRLNGAVVIVLHDGRPLYRRAAGFADAEARTPMRLTSVFRLASLTKPMVSAAALRLVEQGKLRLDDPVSKWLPEFRPELPDGTRPTITIHQLLTHTSGLGYRFAEAEGGAYGRLNVSDGLDQPGLSAAENLKRLAAAPLKRAPGSGWEYSLSLDVLGAAMEKAGGAPLPELVDRLVLRPLALRDTGFVVRDAARLVVPHADGKPAPVRMTDATAVPFGEGKIRFAPSRALDAASYPSGGAGMVGTAPDFARFLEAIRTGGAPILRQDSIAAMLRDQVGASAITQGPGWGFGYGWSVLVDPAAAGTPQSAGTIGWGGVYGHHWFVDPARQLTVVVLTDTGIEGMMGRFPNELRAALYAGLDAGARPRD